MPIKKVINIKVSKDIKCVLFDLDGTLLDTSFDFSYALNKTLKNSKKKSLPYWIIRQSISDGAMAMVKLAFPELSDVNLQKKRNEFIKIYKNNIALHTQLFPNLNKALELLEKNKIPWGIVTNKHTFLVNELLKSISWNFNPNTIICGDTLSVNKPDPAPLLLAAKECGIPVEQCIYIGDHPRDIQAGKNACMQTAAALFGFIPTIDNARDELNKADYVFHSPNEITNFIQKLTADKHKLTSN